MPQRADDQPSVAILLAVYNGARFLDAQLGSYAAQTHRAWSLVASDDGSDDDSRARIAAFAAAHPNHSVTLRDGPRAGFVRNFLSLVQQAPQDAAYVALSDQDDVWLPEKLARAVARLETVSPQTPALYCAATMICDQDLAPLGPSARFRRPPDFRNALVQSIGGGNTMVLNRAALTLAARAAAEAPDPVAHDWWLYQIITGCGGQVLRDDEPVLLYRQHGGNLIGANVTWQGRIERLWAVLVGGRFRRWGRQSLTALAPSAHRFTPEAQQILAQYQAARHGWPWQRLRALRASGAHRQSRLGTFALYAACLLGRM